MRRRCRISFQHLEVARATLFPLSGRTTALTGCDVVVVRLMGHQIDRQTDLVLRDGDEEVEFKDFPMTEDNLRAIMRHR